MNIFHLLNNKHHTDEIWKIIRSMKAKYVSMNCIKGLIGVEAIRSQVETFQQNMHVVSSANIYKNITERNLKEGAEMFIYLASCSRNLNPLFSFFENLFKWQEDVLTHNMGPQYLNKMRQRGKVN